MWPIAAWAVNPIEQIQLKKITSKITVLVSYNVQRLRHMALHQRMPCKSICRVKSTK